MPMIQGIDGSALINAFRNGRHDRIEWEDARMKRELERHKLDNEQRVRGVVGQLLGRDAPQSGGVAGAYGLPTSTTGYDDGVPGNNRMDGNAVPIGGAVANYSGGASRNMSRQDLLTSPSLESTSGHWASPADATEMPVQTAETAQALPTQTHRGSGVMTLDQDALAELMGLDAGKAKEIIGAVKAMNDNALEAARARNDAMGTAAHWVMFKEVDGKRVPTSLAERPARLEQVKGYLADFGWPADQLSNVDVTDAGLQRYQRVALGYDKLFDNEAELRRVQNTEANTLADNVRQDRNTESLIEDRKARRASQDRYNEGRLGVARDRATTYRNNSSRTGGKSGASAPVKVSTPAEAMKLPKGTRYVTPDGKVMVR